MFSLSSGYCNVHVFIYQETINVYFRRTGCEAALTIITKEYNHEIENNYWSSKPNCSKQILSSLDNFCTDSVVPNWKSNWYQLINWGYLTYQSDTPPPFPASLRTLKLETGQRWLSTCTQTIIYEKCIVWCNATNPALACDGDVARFEPVSQQRSHLLR